MGNIYNYVGLITGDYSYFADSDFVLEKSIKYENSSYFCDLVRSIV